VGSVTLGDERQLNPFMRVSNPAFSRMTSRRAASLQLETKGTEWPLKGLFARKSKGELYLHDHEAGRYVVTMMTSGSRSELRMASPVEGEAVWSQCRG
jgi:hypothetical protein